MYEAYQGKRLVKDILKSLRAQTVISPLSLGSRSVRFPMSIDVLTSGDITCILNETYMSFQDSNWKVTRLENNGQQWIAYLHEER